MYGYYRIKINCVSYTPDFQTAPEFASKWKSVLRNASANKTPGFCQCVTDGVESARKLGAKHLSPTDTFFLAKRSDTGPQHHRDCRFYAPDRFKSGYGAYSDGVVDDNDGIIRIKVGMGVKVQDERAHSTIPDGERRPGATLPRVTLLGLLHLLWDKAGLNECHPESIGKRGNVEYRLHESASAVHIGRFELQSHLLVFNHAKKNKSKLSAAISKKRRLFALAPLSPWEQPTEPSGNGVLRLVEAGGMPQTMQLIPGLWEKTERSFPLAVTAWRHGERVMALAQLEPVPNSWTWDVVGICLMQITDNWIAVESSYEKQVADALVAAGRRFEKPLRFDAGKEVVFPDFILRDTGNEPRGTPMEVFGRDDEAYSARQQTKTGYYNEQFGADGWWCWQPLTKEALPAFPLKVEK